MGHDPQLLRRLADAMYEPDPRSPNYQGYSQLINGLRRKSAAEIAALCRRYLPDEVA